MADLRNSGRGCQSRQPRNWKSPGEKLGRSSSEHRNKWLRQQQEGQKVGAYRSVSTESWRGLKHRRNSRSFFPETTFERNQLENSFPGFFTRVNCPFCLAVQEDKIVFIKHLDEGCSMKTKSNIPTYSIFKILSDNSINCTVCRGERIDSLEAYFLHLFTKEHSFRCSEAFRKGNRLTDLLYCSCCYLKVPNNLTQLQYHLQSEIHEARRSGITFQGFREKGFSCTYVFSNGRKTFHCLACPPPGALFYTPLEMMNHFKTVKHLQGRSSNFQLKIYCGFCKVEFGIYETPFHFVKAEHLQNATVAEEEMTKLCFFCGFSCSNLEDLSSHMRRSCSEIQRLRVEKQPKQKPMESSGRKAAGKCRKEAKEKKKDHCILVKDDVNLDELHRTLTQFGKIHSITKCDGDHLLIEFKDKTSVEDIHLVKNLLKNNGRKLCIKFPQELKIDEPETTKTSNN